MFLGREVLASEPVGLSVCLSYGHWTAGRQAHLEVVGWLYHGNRARRRNVMSNVVCLFFMCQPWSNIDGILPCYLDAESRTDKDSRLS